MISFLDKNLLSGKKAEDVMFFPYCVSPDDSVSTTQSIMKDIGTTRIPVIEQEKVIGLVESHDLLKTVIPKRKEHRGERKGVKTSSGSIQISSFTKRNYVVCEKGTDLKKVVDQMSKGIYTAMVEDKGKFAGMFTLKDVFKLAGRPYRKAYIRVSGLGGEDEYIVSILEKMTNGSVEKLSKILPVNYLAVHIERYRKGGSRTKYSVQGRLVTEKGTFHADHTEWDLTKAMREFLGKIEREVKRELGKQRIYDSKI